MNRNVGILIAVLGVFALGLGGFKLYDNAKKLAEPQLPSKNMGSINDILQESGNLECNFTDENGRKIKAYVKNGKVRAEINSSNPADTGSVILSGDTLYIWSSTQAVYMNIPKQTLEQDISSNPLFNQKDNIMQSIQKYKENCKNANPDSSLFTPPSNIKFKDASALMQQYQGQ